MASTYQLVIDNGSITSTTGHHTIDCHIEETQADGTIVKGMPERYGIEGRALRLKHNGDANLWREWVAGEMLRHHQARVAVNAEVMQWNGKKFDITIPADPV